jgi:NADH-quinone oxidoreductase subunit M
MLSMVQRVFFGPLSNPKNKHLSDMNPREIIAIAPLIALIFVIGLFPNLFINRTTAGVATVIERYVEARKAYQEQGDSETPRLLERQGGTLDQGYPEGPTKKTDGAAPAQAQALNAEAP